MPTENDKIIKLLQNLTKDINTLEIKQTQRISRNKKNA
jgi:hypothetical protein